MRRISSAALAFLLLAGLPLLHWCFAPPRTISMPPDAVRHLGAALPVFPGAEGFGSDTPAGRAGAILRVSTLSDSGPGSLREALATPGPRMVVFEVGGIISLKSNLVINEPFLTLAGQTAPNPGITLQGAGLNIATHDVLVQHMAVRVGDQPGGPAPEARDGIAVYPGRDGTHGVVVDHCSVTWAVDENMSHWGRGVHDITFRNCLVAEALSHSIHPKGEHSKGLLLGDFGQRISVIGCLFAHNVMRNPFVKGGVSALIANNVIYNPGDAAIHLGDIEGSGPSWVTAAGNVLIPGPDTAWYASLAWMQTDAHPDARLFLHDNQVNARRGWHAWRRRHAPVTLDSPADAPVWVTPLTLRGGEKVLEWVLKQAGSRPVQRDTVDTRIVESVGARTGRILDHPQDAGGMPEIQSARHRLQLPEHPNLDEDLDGYSNAEEWLHDCASAAEGQR